MKGLFTPPCLLLFLLLLLLLPVSSATSFWAKEKPNIVLMMVDDLGIGDLGCYGNNTISTPHIDRLAQMGVRLTQHLAAAPLCTPSRAAFLTGRYPVRSGMVGLGRVGAYIFSASSGGLPSNEVTFAKLAQGQGYNTALIGKWHLGLNCEHAGDHCHHPANHGFDLFYGTPMTHLRDCIAGHGSVFAQVWPYVRYVVAASFWTAVLCFACLPAPFGGWRVGLGLLLIGAATAGLYLVFDHLIGALNCVLMRDQQVVEKPYVSEDLTARMTWEAVDFMERNSGKPFLLFLSFLQVHTALFATPTLRESGPHGIYGDAVREVDWAVGFVVDTLERLNLRGNTLVYLTSDQGAHLEEVSDQGEVHHGSNGVYKAGKSTNWEGGIRVPGILSLPGLLPRGRVVDQPTSHMDLLPTLTTLMGAPLPHDRQLDGHDLMPLLLGRATRSSHEFLFHYCNAHLNAVRWHPPNSDAAWKAFYFTPVFTPPGGESCTDTLVCLCHAPYVTHHDPPLLYDLSRDPSEATPLTPTTEPRFAVIMAAMAAAVERHLASLEPADDQMALGHVLWKPWLQPSCPARGGSGGGLFCREERHRVQKATDWSVG
ncbi:steryl-sulfatase isoform X2 [Gadus chalcogrammus]|uniref:steryl-sulfatase isoform X2 n=1 Tax=Gadus chalcogrammus TaxID=1042646 RepID=UPI0024C4E591|nr:steryl-sulfatase isoform X2 [Gadus chalcogrammus]